jgi:phosphoribosylanthranilate isomerase
MNNDLHLKVCGLTQLNQIQELISMNIDFLGFIFYEKSPRYALNRLSLKDISEIIHQGKVGVFVNEDINTILDVAEQAELNFIQLHGDESDHYVSELRKKLNPKIGIIKVFRIGDTIESLKIKIESIELMVNYLLFDTDSKAFGGTGKQFNWSLLNNLEINTPYFLSGGISDENIEGIKVLNKRPFALDINSKFETEPGIKNVEKIRLFRSNFLKSNL